MGGTLAKFRALEVLDGLLMSDGGLKRYEGGAYYEMVQSKSLSPRNSVPLEQERLKQESLRDHLKWEQWIADNVFAVLGISTSEKHPKIITGSWKGKPHLKAILRTCLSPLLTQLHNEWYSGGEWINHGTNWYLRGATKRIPERLMQASKLTTHTLVHEFLGDGGSSWSRRNGHCPYVQLTFSTGCFTDEEVSHLTLMLNNIGIATVKPNKDKKVERGSGLTIWLSATASNTNHFMGIVEPHILEIFGESGSPSYKDMIKWRLE